jgi:hypothetical protein
LAADHLVDRASTGFALLKRVEQNAAENVASCHPATPPPVCAVHYNFARIYKTLRVTPDAGRQLHAETRKAWPLQTETRKRIVQLRAGTLTCSEVSREQISGIPWEKVPVNTPLNSGDNHRLGHLIGFNALQTVTVRRRLMLSSGIAAW